MRLSLFEAQPIIQGQTTTPGTTCPIVNLCNNQPFEDHLKHYFVS